MSNYDRRTWQRPKGERTADPGWEDQALSATTRPPKVRGTNNGRTNKSAIAGNHGRRQLRALLRNKYQVRDE